MPGEIVTNPDAQPINVSTAWTPLLDVNTMSLFGMNVVTLTNWDASTTLPQIAQGSAIDIDGSVARYTTTELIGGAPANGTVYVKFIVTGTDVAAELTATAPTWDNTKGGWYNGSGERYSGHLMTKNGSVYTDKTRLRDEASGDRVTVGPYTEVDASLVTAGGYSVTGTGTVEKMTIADGTSGDLYFPEGYIQLVTYRVTAGSVGQVNIECFYSGNSIVIYPITDTTTSSKFFEWKNFISSGGNYRVHAVSLSGGNLEINYIRFSA